MIPRQLANEEVAALEQRGCTAENWNAVFIRGPFQAERYANVRFYGTVELGRCNDDAVTGGDGFPHPAGVYDSRLRDVSLGDECLICHSALSGVDVADRAVIWHVPSFARNGNEPFANGSPAHALAEDGARAILLWRGLGAPMAHLLCHMKNHPAGNALEAMISRDAETLRHQRCRAGKGCRVLHTGVLENVWIGDGAHIQGAASLKNCYVSSQEDAPAFIGEGVAAEDCIFQDGCRVAGGTRLSHCLAGEGVVLENAFFAKHSLFFANAHFALGEAASVLAGPYAVSTHKATLALTCECSFGTFGSASNSSNHHFKLGPLHGGVLRRGVRCGSGSYIFWPSDIGAFSTVTGRHTTHLDTADFPFSLLIAREEGSVLIPGVNLFSVGLYRDELKWPARDRRKGVHRPRDPVNAAVLSPYVLQAVEKAITLLRRSEGVDVEIRHGGAVIPASRIGPALRLYETVMTYYVGLCLLEKACADRADGGAPEADDVVRALAETPPGDADPSMGVWRDWGGMLLSGRDADAIVHALELGAIAEAEPFRLRLEESHRNYRRNAFFWAARRWRRENGEIGRSQIVRFFDKWRDAVLFRHDRMMRDIGKEFARELSYGFGVEDDAETTFLRVRGRPEEHATAQMAARDRDSLLELAAAVR